MLRQLPGESSYLNKTAMKPSKIKKTATIIIPAPGIAPRDTFV